MTVLATGAPPLPRIEHVYADAAAVSVLDGRLADAYGSPLAIARRADRPTVVANFVSTLDGVVSYATPEAAGGGEISGFHAPDRFVMSLLRGLADAVLIGAGTLRAGIGEAWTPDYIYPDAADEIAELRRRLSLAPQPSTVVVTASGDVDTSHPGLASPDVPALMVTTRRGARRIGRPHRSNVEVVVTGEERVEPCALLDELGRRGFGAVVCEGGPHLTASLIEQQLVDELFMTLAPQIAGRSESNRRLALVEGVAFSVADAPWWRLASLGRSGDHLFLRYRRRGGDHDEREVRP